MAYGESAMTRCIDFNSSTATPRPVVPIEALALATSLRHCRDFNKMML